MLRIYLCLRSYTQGMVDARWHFFSHVEKTESILSCFRNVTMDTGTRDGHKPHDNDSAHQALWSSVNIKSVAQLVAELLTSKPGSATNFIPNYNSLSPPSGPIIDIWALRFRRHNNMSERLVEDIFQNRTMLARWSAAHKKRDTLTVLPISRFSRRYHGCWDSIRILDGSKR